ncbi:MAG: sigma-70 family RNA polymerase sigma factor [Planctomycetota bacterium]
MVHSRKAGLARAVGFEAQMLEDHQEALRRFAIHLVGDVESAEEILQDTYLRALKSPPSIENQSQLRAWLRKVLYRVFLRHLRDQMRAKKHRSQFLLVAERSEEEDRVVSAQEQLETHRLLLDQLDAMGEIYQRTLVARFFEGLSLQEIANREGVGREAIKSRLDRGLKEFRRRLDDRSNGDRQVWLSALVPLLAPGDLVAIRRISKGLGVASSTSTSIPKIVGWVAASVLGIVSIVAISSKVLEQPGEPIELGSGSSRDTLAPEPDVTSSGPFSSATLVPEPSAPSVSSTDAASVPGRSDLPGGGTMAASHDPMRLEFILVDRANTRRRVAGLQVQLESPEGESMSGVTDKSGVVVFENVVGTTGTLETSAGYLQSSVQWTVSDPADPGRIRIRFDAIHSFSVQLVTESGQLWTSYLDQIGASPYLRDHIASIGFLASPAEPQPGTWRSSMESSAESLIVGDSSRYTYSPTAGGRVLELHQLPPITLFAMFKSRIVRSQPLSSLPGATLSFVLPTQYLTDGFGPVTFELIDSESNTPITTVPEVELIWDRNRGREVSELLGVSNGLFTLSDVPLGESKLEIRAPGYEVTTCALNLESSLGQDLGTISLQAQMLSVPITKRMAGIPVSDGSVYFERSNNPQRIVAESGGKLALEQNALGTLYWAPSPAEAGADHLAMPVGKLEGGPLPAAIDLEIPSQFHTVKFVADLPVSAEPGRLFIVRSSDDVVCASVPFIPRNKLHTVARTLAAGSYLLRWESNGEVQEQPLGVGSDDIEVSLPF